MKRMLQLLVVLCCLSAVYVAGEKPGIRARSEIHLPDLSGYVTLKCDFHMHTVFSDGAVWPTVRVEEAWREGLDAIAITDHIEYLPRAADVVTSSNRNRSAEIARGTGAELDIIVIRGSEITRNMPPGHLNAIFLSDANQLAVPEWRDAAKASHQQGAFIFWNHPGWERQLAEDKVVRWYPEHTELLEGKQLHGIEVFNGRSYYPEAHRWALEKKLTMLSNSDIHAPLNLDYHVHAGDRRPMTLVFAEKRTADAIKEALFARRTAVYAENRLIGEEQFLKPLFEKSIQIKKPQITIKGKQRVVVQIANHSDIDYHLQAGPEIPEVATPKILVLPARKTVLLEVRGKGSDAVGKRALELPYRVTNVLVGPEEPLSAVLTLDVLFGK